MADKRRRRENLGGQQFVVSYHVRHILSMLKTQLHRHADADATASLETLAMAMDLVPDVIRDLGVSVLTCGDASNKEALTLLKLMLAWQPKHRVALTIKMALYLGSHGNFLEAYDTLQSQIQVEPCKSSPHVHGYSGMFKYYMWHEKLLPEAVNYEEEENDRMKVLAGQAVRHFSDMEELDITPSVSGNVDIFMSLHAKLLHWLGSAEEGLQLLISYRDKYPDRLSSCKMVLHYMTESGIANGRMDHLLKLVELDDSAPEVLDLAQLYVSEGRSEEASSLLDRFLQYPHNQRNQLAADLLKHMETSMYEDNSSDSDDLSCSDLSD